MKRGAHITLAACARCGQRHQVLTQNLHTATCARCGDLLAPREYHPPRWLGGKVRPLEERPDLTGIAVEWEAELQKERAKQATWSGRLINDRRAQVLALFLLSAGIVSFARYSGGEEDVPISVPDRGEQSASPGTGTVTVGDGEHQVTGVRKEADEALVETYDPGTYHPELPRTYRPVPGVNGDLRGVQIFPPDNPWNTRIDREPVDPLSAAIIARIGRDRPLRAEFGPDRGIPYIVTDAATHRCPVLFTEYGRQSDRGDYPIPPGAPVDAGDHLILLARDEGKLYELRHAEPKLTSYEAHSGAIWNLLADNERPRGWISADAAGLPVLPGLVRGDEVLQRGQIRHALRFTVPLPRSAFVPPARHNSRGASSEDLPPMGMRVRLKSSFDIRPFPKQVRVVLKALKEYGMFLADRGPAWGISGTRDLRWKRASFAALARVRGEDLEVVRMGKPDSVRDSGPDPTAALDAVNELLDHGPTDPAR